jgi:Flp pilus assembly protein TadG
VVEGALIGGALDAPQPVREPPRTRFGGGLLARLWRGERGTAVVEFALVLLPLSLLVVGILDFGRALQYYNSLTQIAGQGGRAAAVNQGPNGGAADATFQSQIANAATAGELRNGVNVCITAANAQGPKLVTALTVGDAVTVTTTFTFHFIPVLKIGNLKLKAAQTERYEVPVAPGYSVANDVGTC